MENGIVRLLLLAGMLAPLALSAGEAYRMVDETGQVTFTDTPPAGEPGIEVLELQPGPSDESRREAESRLETMRQRLDESRRQREAKTQQSLARVDELQQQLDEAEAKLQEAKILKDEDRQSLAGRGRRIHPDYFKRIEEAEAAVEEARKRLNQARSGR
jgi:hypothetical protein